MALNANQLVRRSSTLLNRCQQCLQIRLRPVRSFSSSAPRQMQMQETVTAKDLVERAGSRQSRRTEMKNMDTEKLPNDMGLLPGTFIRPPNKQMPALFSRKWKTRLKVELHWLKTQFTNMTSTLKIDGLGRPGLTSSLLYVGKWLNGKLPKSERSRLGLGARQCAALELHRAFYTHLAAGALGSLRPIVCDGLVKQASTQISQRESHDMPVQRWARVKFTSPLRIPFHSRLVFWPLTSLIPFTQAKVMSDRIVPLPMGVSGHIRQCVVRIRSLQRLDRDIPSPSTTSLRPTTVSDLTEYVVIQKIRIQGQQKQQPQQHQQANPDPWKLWGTIPPTSEAEMEAMVSENVVEESKVTLADRMRKWSPLRLGESNPFTAVRENR